MIVWTPEVRARVYPSRKHPNPEWLRTATEDAGDPYERMVAQLKDSKDAVKRAKQALAKNPPAWKPIVEQALARAAKPTATLLELDAEVATVALELCDLFDALRFWIAEGGIPFALRALIRTTEIASSWVDHGYSNGLWILETRKVGWDRPRNSDGCWALMRAVLAEAIEPVYDEAHGIADEAFQTSAGLIPNESVLQAMIPFAFPDEPAWAKAGAKSAIALAKQRARASTGHLGYFVSVAPVEQAVELLTCTVNDALSADDLWTALAHHGAAGGVKIVEAALSTAPNNERREQWSEPLFAIRTPEAMKAFERLAKHPKGKKTFAPLAKQHRELILVTAARKPHKKSTKR